MPACRLRNMSMVNPLGGSPKQIMERLLNGSFDPFTRRTDLVPGKEVLVGEVREPLPQVPENLAKFASRNTALLLLAFSGIEPEVRDWLTQVGPERIGVILGSSTSGISRGEEALKRWIESGSFPKEFCYRQQEMGSVAEVLARSAGVKGPAYTVSTACSSSAKVFRSAKNWLDVGLVDAVIVGGVDSLCQLTLNGFYSLELLSKERCNPMSRNRTGITIGEGVALFLLTPEEGGIQVMGVGESSDAYHISAPDPEGYGAELAMREALQESGLKAEEISYINLHGTGTLQNDAMESKAIARIFPPETLCSSTKSLTGHLLGASGATEIGFCWMMLREAFASEAVQLAPHWFDGELDEFLPALRLVEAGMHLPTAERKSLYMLSNSFAFGGNNCAVILGVNR